MVFVLALALSGQPQTQTPPSVPAPGELHIPPNTRVVQGTVTDRSGAPVAHAAVLLKDTKTLQIRSYITQNDGTYKFYGLSSDVNYTIRAESGELTSPDKDISVFNSHKVIKVDLKIKDKKQAG